MLVFYFDLRSGESFGPRLGVFRYCRYSRYLYEMISKACLSRIYIGRVSESAE